MEAAEAYPPAPRASLGRTDPPSVLIPTASRASATTAAAISRDIKQLLVLTDVAFRSKWPKEGASSAWKTIEGADNNGRLQPPPTCSLREGQVDSSSSERCGVGSGLAPPGLGSRKKRVRSKRFECSDCGKAFATKYECTRHERIHTGERPFRCSKCVRAFADKGNLKKHQLVHTRHRPHICSSCGKSFSRRTHLRMHALRVHAQMLTTLDDGTGSMSGSEDGRSGNESDHDPTND